MNNKVTAIKLKENVEIIYEFGDGQNSYVFDAREARDAANLMRRVLKGRIVKTRRTVKPITHRYEIDEEFNTGTVYPVKRFGDQGGQR